MYFEEAKVKEYYRKNKEGKKTPYYQIRLKRDSKFNGVNEVALVDISEIKSMLKEYDVNKISELKEELKELKKENKQLNKDKSELQQKLINSQDKNEELHEELLTEKDLVKKEQNLTKTLLAVRTDLLNRNLIDRIRNKEPESSIIIKTLKKVPVDVEDNDPK